MFAALARQKYYFSLYLMSIYSDEKKKKDVEYMLKKKSNRVDIGKSCIRFKTLDELDLDYIMKMIKKETIENFIEKYKESRKK